MPTSVVVFSFTFSRIPIFFTIGRAEERRSTACPPNLGSGDLSTMVIWQVGMKRCNQYAVTGPAMPEPDIRILRGCVADGILKAVSAFDEGVGFGCMN